ncbi:MAG: methyltransferase domain-containing protein [Bacteroidota bacterium]|nr:methyltransferase domain-containing protein [Bacteroidota bacterium]
MKNIFLWIQLLKQIKVTGAVAFSSGTLVKRMLKTVNFSNAEVIIELGAGSGCITELLAKKIKPSTTLIVFEVNEIFCKMLRQKFTDSNIYIINDSAENLDKHLYQISGFKKADFVISSLPFSIIDEATRNKIINTIKHALKPHSLYIQYGYNKKKYHEILNRFQTVKTSFVLGNLPPAYIFNCQLQ